MNAVLIIDPEEEPYAKIIKPYLSSIPASFVITQPIQYLAQLTAYCKKRNVTKVISTSAALLWKLVQSDWPAGNKKRPSISDYAGSVYDLPGIPGGEILFINPLKQLVTMPAARFICSRFISKLTNPEQWNEPTEFQFTVCDLPSKLEEAYEYLSRSFAIATDIETIRIHVSISCVGYTGATVDSAGNIHTRSFVIPFTSGFNLSYVRKINALPCPKIFQNGKYDNAYFLRFDAPVTNWIGDTAHLFHSWYSELPKDLGFLNAFFMRKVQYWKDLAKTNDKYTYYKYNALDTWVTFNVWLIQISQMPAWARKNYTLEFPLVFPCLLSEMTGIARDAEALKLAHEKESAELAEKQASLNKILGVAYFNTNSAPQMKALFVVLGLSQFAKRWVDGEEKESQNEIVIKKARLAHSFSARILDLVLEIRGIRKNLSTYLITDPEKRKEWYGYELGQGSIEEAAAGRILYALNPHGTDTARLSSNKHAFWCGFNFQTAPREGSYKTTIRSDPGLLLAECDLKQAESRDAANISGDSALLAALDSGHDFHALNASAFFGIKYELIFSDELCKTLDKKLRDLAKRTNHGATYNMGVDVLIDTMGLDKIYEARALLKLPQVWTAQQIGAHLLGCFHKTYPGIAGMYYPWVIGCVKETSMLVSRAMHHVDRTSNLDSISYTDSGDWTRYCFGKPDKNKRDLNALVAHCPQSLNARTLNEAYLRVFYDCALGNPEFRLHAQIHDSILYSFRAGTHEKYNRAVKERMEIPVTIRSCDGKIRTFTVPADVKAGKDGEGVVFWSMTE
jgi:DNA polymerase I-like protein with 3'-5' exonuclease and polymerase domains